MEKAVSEVTTTQNTVGGLAEMGKGHGGRM
jgi:hypothetical protein